MTDGAGAFAYISGYLARMSMVSPVHNCTGVCKSFRHHHFRSAIAGTSLLSLRLLSPQEVHGFKPRPLRGLQTWYFIAAKLALLTFGGKHSYMKLVATQCFALLTQSIAFGDEDAYTYALQRREQNGAPF